MRAHPAARHGAQLTAAGSLAAPESAIPSDALHLDEAAQAELTVALREAWINLIKCEDLTVMRWTGNDDRAKSDPLSPQYVKFLAETKPAMIWDMEVDVYKAGDQRGAAVRMLEHLEKNITHNKATEWEREFRELVDPTAKEKVAEESTEDAADPS